MPVPEFLKELKRRWNKDILKTKMAKNAGTGGSHIFSVTSAKIACDIHIIYIYLKRLYKNVFYGRL